MQFHFKCNFDETCSRVKGNNFFLNEKSRYLADIYQQIVKMFGSLYFYLQKTFDSLLGSELLLQNLFI